MLKKILCITCLPALLIVTACQFGKQDTLLRKFAAEFSAVEKNYSEKLSRAKTADEHSSCLKEKYQQLNELLDKYDKSTNSEGADLLKSKLLVELSRYKEARQKVDLLINNKSPLWVDAEMVKVQILIRNQETDEALKLLKEIEPGVKKGPELYSAWLYFAAYSNDLKTMNEYAKKFTGAPDCPPELSKYNTEMYRILAVTARDNSNTIEAKNMLDKAFTSTSDKTIKQMVQSEIAQLDLMGKPAPAIYGETWLNSPALFLPNLKGSVTVLFFWSPWCDASKKMLPVIIEEFNAKKTSGLNVIGYTQLYGKFNTDKSQIALNPPLTIEAEIAAIQQFLAQKGATFPICISNEGLGFEDYKTTAVPTVFFIDKLGNISDFKTGTFQPQLFRDKIKKLMEEPYGKDQSK